MLNSRVRVRLVLSVAIPPYNNPEGFNYAYRRTATVAPTPNSVTSALPASKSSTPIPDRSAPPHLAADTSKDSSSPSTPASSNVKPNGLNPEKAEKERQKKKEKKERKDKERAEKIEKEKTEKTGDPTAEPSTSTPDTGAKSLEGDELKSPVTDGVRTPKTGRAPRNPWTIFMKMSASISVADADIKEFFGDAKGGVRISHLYLFLCPN